MFLLALARLRSIDRSLARLFSVEPQNALVRDRPSRNGFNFLLLSIFNSFPMDIVVVSSVEAYYTLLAIQRDIPRFHFK